MAAGRNLLSPRGAVPEGVGLIVQKERRRRRWSQARLAQKAGVERRTILRLEQEKHVPGYALVRALERILKLDRPLVPAWEDSATADQRGAWGPRARLARHWAKRTLAQVADASGLSAATISRFEREMGDTALILENSQWGVVGSTAYAHAIGFNGKRQMTDYLQAADPKDWLERNQFAEVNRGAVNRLSHQSS